MVWPDKHSNLVELVRRHVAAGSYLILPHALARQHERVVSDPEIAYVLRNGRHERGKDQFSEEHHAWSYAIRGKTVDQESLRVVVSFEDDLMLVVTVIDLEP